ncbi:MAG TPA: hypothetical protein VH163_07800, partial [Gemmatimonadales bacterium]|nr:hypothetical protein [Gemmatimonadales bacterium]
MRKLLTAALLLAVFPAAAQMTQRAPTSAPPLNIDSLRANLFALAADSMGGRQTGSLGDWKGQEWVAAELKAAGWLPAGENGGYFQVVPFIRIYADPAMSLGAGAEAWSVGKNMLPLGPAVTHDFAAVPTVYGGSVDQPETWPDSAAVAGRVVVFSVPDSIQSFRPMLATLQPISAHAGMAQAAGLVVAGYDRFPPDLIPQILAGRLTTDTTPVKSPLPPRFLITPRSAQALFGVKAKPGTVGPRVSGSLRWLRQPLEHPARNIIAVLPGSDPVLKAEYVSMSAHHDHVGFT